MIDFLRSRAKELNFLIMILCLLKVKKWNFLLNLFCIFEAIKFLVS
jgi:hypothetical protein